ncbi:MAG: TIGR03986 family CRISPR-associated RAMP protein, partial [Eubacteriales bacterium]|nr:TIGR03986 family CRISPR-associated RAMP protein [Eubacteriales bacterium]
MANDNIDIDALMRRMNSGGSRFEDTSSAGRRDQKYGGKGKQDSGNGRNRQNSRNGGNGADGRRQNGNRNGDRNRGYRTSYVGAPYNFVPVPKPFAVRPEKGDSGLTLGEGNPGIRHDLIDPSLYTGELHYTAEAMTHLFISDGTKHKDNTDIYPQFVRDLYGRLILPGSSVRGLIRSNAQILGMGDIGGDVDDYSLLFRAVATGMRDERRLYADILGAKQVMVDGHQTGVLTNVRAGYLCRENGKYFIYPTVRVRLPAQFGEMNYYVLNERWIIEDHLKNPADTRFSFFLDNPKKHMQYDPSVRMRREERTDRQGRVSVHYRGRQNRDYQPYSEPVIYKLSGDRNVVSVRNGPLTEEMREQGYREGYVLSSGIMQEKKAQYIIPCINRDTENRVEILPEDLRAYQIDYEKKKKALGEKQASFFALPEEGEMRPCFYVGPDVNPEKRTYFGFTPRLRLFYSHTVKEYLGREHTGKTFDIPSAIFGYSRGKEAYKSRVSFGDAVVEEEKENRDGSRDPGYRNVPLILSEPKASSVADYIRQNGVSVKKTYNTDRFQLRGVKQYWLHKEAQKPDIDLSRQGKMVTWLNPVKPGTRFHGIVRFHNLTKEELGLLLWSIRLEEDSWMNLGQGKPYGYGAVKITIDDLRVADPERAYDPGNFSMTPWEEKKPDIDAFINRFKEYMGKHTPGTVPYDQREHVRI